MKRILITLAIVLTAVNSLFAALPCDSVLRRQAARMLMVGFKGDKVDENSDAARYIRDLKVGAIILFDVDLTGSGKIGSRNITGSEQLKTLTTNLHRWADYPLIVTADQEGGLVARLKTQYGFQPTVTSLYLGQCNNEDTTRYYARRIAAELANHGINLNLAPVVDIHNPDCPPLGKYDRCYSDNPGSIVRHASWFIDESRKSGVGCTLKHFPGHGSAINDSHWGLVDVSSTWSPRELEPFKKLIKKGKAQFIMTAHIFNNNLDADYPATLSRKTITGVLREQLHYDGVVITDDMFMQGIIDHYSIEQAIVLAINAGADMLCVGNNINTGFEPDRPFRLVDIIVKAVKEGRIPYGRIQEANRRIERASATLGKFPQ